MAETGRIRKKRNKFSQVSNHCLRNDKLTLKAKGLYALIQSFIDIPDFTLYKSVLMDKYCVEGREAFNNTWKELINAGYLKTYKVNTHNGFVYEYELLDEPEAEETPETPNDEGSGVDERNPITTKVRQLSPGTENPYVGPGTAFPGVDSPGVGNPSLNNTNNNYTNNKYTDLYNNNNIENNLKDSGELQTNNFVVENNKKNYSFSKPSKTDIQDEIKQLEKQHLKENSNLDCFKSRFGLLYMNDYPEGFKYLLNLQLNHLATSAKIKMFDIANIERQYIVNCEVYNSVEISDTALNLLNNTMESFINEDRLKILKLPSETISDLYEESLKILAKDTELVPVGNKIAYLSQIIRSKIANLCINEGMPNLNMAQSKYY